MSHNGYYTSGEFAKKANVTIRTIRYYDKQGILKPSQVSEAGYRLYTDEDFGRLQKILSLKYLGFSLEEIVAMTINDEVEDIAHSLDMQRELIEKRIRHLQMMARMLDDTAHMLEESEHMDWNNILNLIHITNMEHALVDQYKTAVNLNVRIALHKRFSHNPVSWFSWLASQVDFERATDILEVGCGNGELWQEVEPSVIAGKRVFLTDLSAGMVEDAQRQLGHLGGMADMDKGAGERKDSGAAAGEKTATGTRPIFFFQTADCQNLPFENDSFDRIIANHVLFYVKNLNRALEEVSRVMRENGIFYCSAYGREHMREITSLVQEFDPRITLSEVALYDLFGLENGADMLGNHFESVKQFMYDDYLLVDEAEPLLDYILSCHGNQSEILNQRQLEFKKFLQKKMKEHGGIRITKMAGIFICRKQKQK